MTLNVEHAKQEAIRILKIAFQPMFPIVSMKLYQIIHQHTHTNNTHTYIDPTNVYQN